MSPHAAHRFPARRALAARLLASVIVPWIACGAPGAAAAADAPAPSVAPLRVASAFDPQTLDPHALALLYNTRIVFQVYECLVARDPLYRLVPQLATAWRAMSPTTWRFELREGVRFHEGQRFTADDAVFSIERALAKPSQRAFQLQGIRGARRIDDRTVEVQLDQPDAVLPEKLAFIAMMSKPWAQQHGAARAQDFNAKQELHTVRHANGTGPYRVQRYEPDVRTDLVRHDAWWGGPMRAGQVPAASFLTIKGDATRVAALTSGEADLVLDPPFQDIARLSRDASVQLATTLDLSTNYLAFNQHAARIGEGAQAIRNPFRDRRVRQAVAQAINVPLIVDKVMRGQAEPAGALFSPRVDGHDRRYAARLPHDPARARALLAEAGWPDGFEVTLDCVNIAWREGVCQAATAMLNQVGIRARLRSTPTAQFFPKLSQGTADFIEFGWTPTTDPWSTLNGLLRTFTLQGGGTFNAGRYANPELDRLIDAIRTEPDLGKRRTQVGAALKLAYEDLAILPLFQRRINWAMRRDVTVLIRPDDLLELNWVRRTAAK